MSSGTRIRREAVVERDFLEAYIKGAKAGKTNDEVAKELGMAPASVTSRASALRKKYAEKGLNLPTLRSNRDSKATLEDNIDFVKSLLSEANDDDDDETAVVQR